MERKAIKRRAIIHIEVGGRYAEHISIRQLTTAARAALDRPGVARRVELTIVVTGDAQLRKLNRQFRHIDTPTDVLSFNADDGSAYLGDIVISYPKAKAQAKAGGHPIAAELQLLVVHGVLHLLGHDHHTRAEQAKMWRAQSAVLRSIGAAITEPKE
jgi:probable rRNA maturation factor